MAIQNKGWFPNGQSCKLNSYNQYEYPILFVWSIKGRGQLNVTCFWIHIKYGGVYNDKTKFNQFSWLPVVLFHNNSVAYFKSDIKWRSDWDLIAAQHKKTLIFFMIILCLSNAQYSCSYRLIQSESNE